MKKIIILLLISLFFSNCKEKEEVADFKPYSGDENKIVNSVNDFIWKSMNSWYKWQDKVPKLQDETGEKDGYSDYLEEFTSEELFESLRYKIDDVDRFSWFIEDYEEQSKAFQGIKKSFGVRPLRLELHGGNEIMLISNVNKKSPAFDAGIKRGDLVIGFNGRKFKTDGYDEVAKVYYDTETVEFLIGNEDGVTVTKKVTLIKEELKEEAVQATNTFEVNGEKVGYLSYNGFWSSDNANLNDTFAQFKSQNLTNFILDLRYNGGGSILSSVYLASLIYGEGTESDIYMYSVFNSKHPNEKYELNFLDGIHTYGTDGNIITGGDIPLNRLKGIQKLYVLTSSSTASASEIVINGLKPYMDVVIIGGKTVGKNVGSITLYDSPQDDYTKLEKASTKHRHALQPIVLQAFNKLDQSDFSDGFLPDISVNEYYDLSTYLSFGSENERLTKVALDIIRGVSPRLNYSINHSKFIKEESLVKSRFNQEMYFESNFLQNILKK